MKKKTRWLVVHFEDILLLFRGSAPAEDDRAGEPGDRDHRPQSDRDGPLKKWGLAILLVVLLVLLALALRSRDRLPETPEQTVTEFFTAAGEGDDRAYLRLVTGELRKTLEQARSEAGAEAFRQGLRRSAGGIKGLAVTRAEGTPAPMAAIDVEIVFADRNERQRMLLAPTRGGWAIASIEQAEMVKPPIAYGTPVFDAPEPEEPADPPPQSTQPSPEP